MSAVLQKKLYELIETAQGMQQVVEREAFVSRVRTSDGESYKLMPETCPLLDAIFEQHASGVPSRTKRELLNQIKSQVTNPFRAALQKACADRAHLMQYLAHGEEKLTLLKIGLDATETQFAKNKATDDVVQEDDNE